MSSRNRRGGRRLTLSQRLWRHYKLGKDGSPYEVEVFSKRDGYRMYEGRETIQDMRKVAEHYGRKGKENCAKCRAEGQNSAKWHNELTGLGVAVTVLGVLTLFFGLLGALAAFAG